MRFQKGHKINIGRRVSEKTRSKIRKALVGKPNPSAKNLPQAFKKGSTSFWKGKTLSKIHRENISISKKGGDSLKSFILCIRKLYEYRQWRSDCMTRDDYTCQICGIRGGKLHIDHIIPFAFLIRENNIKTIEDALMCEELWNINNGRTLCVICHRQTDTYGGKMNRKIYANLRK